MSIMKSIPTPQEIQVRSNVPYIWLTKSQAQYNQIGIKLFNMLPDQIKLLARTKF